MYRFCAIALFAWFCLQATAAAQVIPPTDASGMAWVAGDTFLVVHDGKLPEERDRVRVSLVRLPRSSSGPEWTPVNVAWPEAEGMAHDLEGLARVPGFARYLLVESGDDGAALRRIYLAEYAAGALKIRAVVPWPVEVYNVEGLAVGRVGEHLVFVYAERAHGLDHTDVRWASLRLDPLEFGAFGSLPLAVDDPVGADARPVSALEFDAAGRLYAASAFDPDTEDGPYRSVVWRIGALDSDGAGRPRLRLHARPERLATLDGLKVESLAVREQTPGDVELFVGTDDEFYGAVVRPLPLRP